MTTARDSTRMILQSLPSDNGITNIPSRFSYGLPLTIFCFLSQIPVVSAESYDGWDITALVVSSLAILSGALTALGFCAVGLAYCFGDYISCCRPRNAPSDIETGMQNDHLLVDTPQHRL